MTMSESLGLGALVVWFETGGRASSGGAAASSSSTSASVPSPLAEGVRCASSFRSEALLQGAQAQAKPRDGFLGRGGCTQFMWYESLQIAQSTDSLEAQYLVQRLQVLTALVSSFTLPVSTATNFQRSSSAFLTFSGTLMICDVGMHSYQRRMKRSKTWTK